MSSSTKRMFPYLILFIFIITAFLLIEYIRSALLFRYVRLFLDHMDYRYLGYALLYQYILGLFLICLIADVYNIKESIDNRWRAYLRKFISSFSVVLIALLIITLAGHAILQYTEYRVDPFGRPTELLIIFGRYVLALNIIGFIIIILHYSISPSIYLSSKPKIIISYFKYGIKIIKNNKENIFIYIILGLILSMIISYLLGVLIGILLGFFGIDKPIYFDESLFQYSKTGPGLVDYVMKNIAYTSSVISELIFITLYLKFYGSYVEKYHIYHQANLMLKES